MSQAALKIRGKLLTRAGLLAWLIACIALLNPGTLVGQTVAVRYAEGLERGFLVLNTLNGVRLADGDLMLAARIGGIEGLLAPLVGKQPPDSHVWILPGETPAFMKAEQQLYAGGPVWRIELASPVWPR